jgi:hypothetical protein
MLLQKTDSKNETVEMLNLFNLLKEWELMVPIALLKALFKRANKITNERLITELTFKGFH